MCNKYEWIDDGFTAGYINSSGQFICCIEYDHDFDEFESELEILEVKYESN